MSTGRARPDERGELPRRTGTRPFTIPGPPHTQLDAHPDQILIDSLADRLFALPSVAERPSGISVPGARALTVDDATQANPQALMIGREFAHLHPDGSLHAVLPKGVAAKAVAAGWAEPHPMAASFNPGAVMLYCPRDPEEMEVVATLVEASWRFAISNPS